MKLAITSTSMELRRQAPIVFRGPDAWCLNQIKKIGYDGVEMHIHDSALLDRGELREELIKNGLTLTSIGTGTAYGKDHLYLASRDRQVREGAVARLRDHMITAADYPHAVVILGLIKGKVSDCGDEKVYRENLIDALRECAEYAQKYQVYLGLEVINRYESDYMNTIDQGLELLDQVGSQFLQLHLDTYHMNIEESDIAAAIHRAAGHICHVHMADNDRWYVGHGHYDFLETVRALRDVGYGHTLAVESLGYPDMLTSAQNSYREMKRILDQLGIGETPGMCSEVLRTE